TMQAAKADMRSMRPLVALVIIMGVLIVAGLIVVVVTIASRLSGGKQSTSTMDASFGTVDLPVPAGCRIDETSTGDGRLILRLGNGERCNQVLIVDLATGRLLGTLRVAPDAQ